MKTNTFKRVLTFIFSLTFVCSTVFGALSVVSAETPRASVSSDNTVDLPALEEGEANLFLGARPKTYYDHGTTTLTEDTNPENDPTGTPLSNTTDGDVATSSSVGGTYLRYNNNGTFAGELWATYWTFDLEKISDISSMTFVHHKTAGLRTEHYQVYLSDTLASIFDSANMYIDVDGNSARRNIITFAENTKARYIGIKYLNPGEGGSYQPQNRYIRLFELALYGVKGTEAGPDGEGEGGNPGGGEGEGGNPGGGEGEGSNPGGGEGGGETPDGDFVMTSTDTYAYDETLGEKNFIAGITGNLNYTYYSDFGNVATKGNVDSIRLGDGLFSDNLRKIDALFSEYDDATSTEKYIGKGIEEGKYFFDLAIPLGGKKNITGIQMMNAKSPIATYKYKIYLANKEEDLFKDENMIIDAVNTNGNKVNTFKKVATKDFIGAFVGIRVIDPTNKKGEGTADAYVESTGKSNVYPRINEFAVFGSDFEAIPQGIVMDNEKEMPEIGKKNLLENRKFASMKFINTDPKHYAGVGTFDCTVSGGGATLTDGDPAGEWRTSSYCAAYIDSDGNAQYIGNGISEGSMYYDFYFDIGTESRLSELAIFHNDSQNLRTAKYELYFGNSASSLFDAENKLTVVSNSEGKQRNLFNLKKLNNNEVVSARYFGIRILDPTFAKGVDDTSITNNQSNGNNIFPRFNEIALYGEYIDPEFGLGSILFDNNAKIPDWGRNFAKEFYPSAIGVSKGVNVSVAVTNGTHINDESVTTDDYRLPYFKFIEDTKDGIVNHTSEGDGEVYVDLLYDLKAEAFIDGISIIHHKSLNLRTKDYELFASVNEDVFAPENSLGRVDNQGFYRNAWNYKELGQTVRARYVGLRIYNPTQYTASQITVSNYTTVYTRLMEWSIFGQYVDPNFVYKEKFTPLNLQTDYSAFEGMGENRLTKKHPVSLITGETIISLSKTEMNNFIDGDVTTGTDIKDGRFPEQDGSKYFQMYYDLSEKGTALYSFTDFVYLGLNQKNTSAATGWWQLYISDDEDMLWDSSKMVFEYNAIRSKNPDVNCQGQKINFDKPIVGCFVGIRILSCNTNLIGNTYPRIYELGIYGDEAPLDKTPVNVAVDMPVDAYVEQASGELEKVDNSGFSAKEAANLTDGKKETAASFKTSKKNLNILYNLCQDIDISEISISAAAGGSFKNVRIYASSDANEVWSSKALVASYSGAGKNTVSKNFSKPKNIRYVRFEILDKADSINIGEVEIIGPKYLLLKSKNLARNNATVEYFTQEIKTGKQTFFTPKGSNKLVNLVTTDAFGFVQGIKGKETVNLLVTLDDLKTINEIKLYFPDRAVEFMPTLTKVYVGTTAEEVLSSDAKPDFTFKGAVKNSSLNVQTNPVVGQYIRIEFVKGGEGYDYFDKSYYALSELRIMGTSVKGINIESGNILQFEDKDLGIKWGINRITTNDIYSEVVSSTVTVSKVTNWQKRSLEKTPYMEIIGGKKYTFKFYDLTGKEVTDFGGRRIEISLKLRNGMSAGTAMIGRSANKWYVEPYESMSDVYDGYVTTYEVSKLDDITFSILNMISSTDPYWDSIGVLEDYGDEKPQYAPTTSLDASTSASKIVTEDGDYYIDPRGALRLPVDAVFTVEITTWEIPENIYGALSANGVANPDEIAVSYAPELTSEGIDHEFDGNVKLMFKIPDVIKGYFSSYQLVNVDDNGNSEFIEYTREGDYIFFETASLDDYALIGVDYHPDGDAVGMDGFVGVDGEISPETGDRETILYIILSAVSLLAILFLNVRKKDNACR